MASTIKKWGHIAPNVPFGVHILAAGLDIAAESTMAEVAKRDTLGLTLFASYKYIQFLHLFFGLNITKTLVLVIFSSHLLCLERNNSPEFPKGLYRRALDMSAGTSHSHDLSRRGYTPN